MKTQHFGDWTLSSPSRRTYSDGTQKRSDSFYWVHLNRFDLKKETESGECSVRFEVFTAVTMISVAFLDGTPCGFCKNRRFGRKYHLHHQGDRKRRARNNVSSSFVPTSPLLAILMTETIRPSKTSVLTRAMRHFPKRYRFLLSFLLRLFSSYANF
jgi:hypothetical protein